MQVNKVTSQSPFSDFEKFKPYIKTDKPFIHLQSTPVQKPVVEKGRTPEKIKKLFSEKNSKIIAAVAAIVTVAVIGTAVILKKKNSSELEPALNNLLDTMNGLFQ